MKTECEEAPRHGADVTIDLHMPDNEGFTEKPELWIDILDLLVEEEAGTSDNTVGLFHADFMGLLLDAAGDQAQAEAIAAWLEGAAEQLRAVYRKEPANG